MTDHEALTRSVCENPADDTPRLVYADWLDEHPVDECDGCMGRIVTPKSRGRECRKCHGAKWLPNDNAARAEFIRVQCEIGLDPLVNARVKALRERERELLGVIPAYRFGGGCLLPLEQFAAGPAVLFVPHPLPGGDVRTGNFLFECIFRRGFVEQVTGPADAFLRHAAVLFAVHPITEVRLTDREPNEYRGVFFWHDDRRDSSVVVPGSAYLPAEVYDRLDWTFDLLAGTSSLVTRDAALSALSAACVAHGRSLAGLSPLIPV